MPGRVQGLLRRRICRLQLVVAGQLSDESVDGETGVGGDSNTRSFPGQNASGRKRVTKGKRERERRGQKKKKRQRERERKARTEK